MFMNWTNLLHSLESINHSLILDAIPHKFLGDASNYSVTECLEWIKTSHEGTFPDELVPIYGTYNSYGYEEDASFLLINPVTGKFYEIHGGHCSCYGFEGQFVPEECPIEYLAKGKKWAEAYETVLEVVKYFEKNPMN